MSKANQYIERPKQLNCKIYRSNYLNIEWIAFACFNQNELIEIFVGELKESNGDIRIPVPSYVKNGIIEKINNEHEHLYNLKFKDKDGYNVECPGINRIFDDKYYNYVVTVSYMLRYLPNETVLKVVKKWKSLPPKVEALRNVLVDILTDNL